MIDVRLYAITDDPQQVTKAATPTTGTLYQGTLRDAGDIRFPTLEFEGDISGFNYMYIPAFARYYYLDPPSVTVTGLMLVTGRVDVLHSFDTDIRGLPAIAARTENENKQDWYLPDSKQPVRSYRHVCTITGSTFDWCNDYILFTAG
jgi:hypothetical protein